MSAFPEPQRVDENTPRDGLKLLVSEGEFWTSAWWCTKGDRHTMTGEPGWIDGTYDEITGLFYVLSPVWWMHQPPKPPHVPVERRPLPRVMPELRRPVGSRV